MTRLVVIGPLPPPYHGVTVSTGLVLGNAALARRFRVEHLDTSDRRPGRTIASWDFQNAYLAITAVVRLFLLLRGPRGVVYMPLSQSTGGLLRDCLFIQVASRRGWKVTTHLRGSEISEVVEYQHWPMRRLIGASFGRTDSLAVLGESLRSVFDGLMPPDRLAVVANGTPDPGVQARPGESETVIFLSNLRRRKGLIEAFEAALMVIEEHPTARFVFAGEWEDLDLAPQLESRAAATGGRITFSPVLRGKDKSAALSAAAFMLFPPVLPEGHPRVVLEGIAHGLPVIATDRGAIADTIIDGESGFVLPDPDPERIAELSLRLLRDPELRDRMGAAARARFEERFTQERADKLFAEWLERVADGTPEPPAAAHVAASSNGNSPRRQTNTSPTSINDR